MAVWTSEQQRERVRKRIRKASDPDSYNYTPAKENNDYAKTDEYQRIAIYARVSTLSSQQTSSYELQQKYYEDLVRRYPKWTLYKIYADEGKSGVTTQQRDSFNEMMKDAMEQKFDLIIVKSISRLARNVVDLLSTVRKLAEKKIGVLFESEAVFSLNDNSHLSLTFQATIAEEESRIRSRSMESSLRMRLDHGLPLTPELLGFRKNGEGKLVINQDTYKIPKLMFYMYLYGYSTKRIAEILTLLSKKTYLGNANWTASGVARSLQNERYCGDVQTRKRFKVFAADVVNQKTFKNCGEKPQSYYKDEHDAIVSRDDFLAVQRIMQNAKFGGTSFLPDLKVIPEGLLKGFVIVHPRWGSFSADDYINACLSVDVGDKTEGVSIKEEKGNFDFRGYEVVDRKLMDEYLIPAVILSHDEVRFSPSCIRSMDSGEYVELMVHPIRKMMAVRPAPKDSKYTVRWAKQCGIETESKNIPCRAYIDTIYDIFGWTADYKYKLYGSIYRKGIESVCFFTDSDISMYIKSENLMRSGSEYTKCKQDHVTDKRIRTVLIKPGQTFGDEYYVEQSRLKENDVLSEHWHTGIEGNVFNTGIRLNITPIHELREFIKAELGDLFEEKSKP